MPALPGRVADAWVDGGGGGGGGVTVHNLLSGRSASGAHPIGAITDLATQLAALIPLAQKAAALGVATLDAGGKIPSAQIPAIALSEFLGTVASEAAMLALVGQRGDWCIRSDFAPDRVFILESDDPTQAANWTDITTPGAVVSVDGQVGAVDLSGVYQAISAALTTLAAAGNAGVLAATTASFLIADETKLDGIEAGAQVNDTAAAILAKLLTVDGAGSGLDADTLDGISSAGFQPILSVPVVIAGTTDTLAAGDNGKINRYTNAALVTVILPTDAADDLPDGFNSTLVAEGAGGLTLDTTGLTLQGGALVTIAQGEALVVIKTATANTWVVLGGTA